jgi:hypothetical protein
MTLTTRHSPVSTIIAALSLRSNALINQLGNLCDGIEGSPHTKRRRKWEFDNALNDAETKRDAVCATFSAGYKQSRVHSNI